ncbi:hypothetical protein [Methylocystis parvus]|uniref:DUF1311 domain-containing protein n=1 Tax=Methylocystis parvus TaxID=134 RepID=A0A6B8M2L7_9HYPH|nr:hypothetical protein [Methylocystis parvus]QGM96608.1 hypothetical protein F7D14_03320 [Methylocystis parvus]WBJ99536.1 hypothetical protein MMG94_16310 [Methylocystis parvus OBBP]
MQKIRVTSLHFAFALAASPAFADCADLAAEEAKVAAAKNCGEAYKIYEACLWGSTADVQRGGTVQEICEKGFLSTLSAARKKRYDREIARCEKEYRNEDGTMYRSMEAVCAAGTARDFWKKFGEKR